MSITALVLKSDRLQDEEKFMVSYFRVKFKEFFEQFDQEALQLIIKKLTGKTF